MAEPELPAPARAGIHVRRYFKFYAMGTAFLVLTAFVPPVERVVPPAFTSRPGGERPATEVAAPGPGDAPSSVEVPAPALGRASAGSPPPSPAPPPAPGGDTTFDPPPPGSPPAPPPTDDEAPDEEECTVPGGSQAVSAARDLNSLVKGGGGPALDPVEDGVTAAAGCEAEPDVVAAGAAWLVLNAGRALP